jgi:hypothetical protein
MWASAFQLEDGPARTIGKDVHIQDNGEEAEVSTVFLTINHDYRGGNPVLFETMIFGGEYDGFQMRYHTLPGARRGHRMIVLALRSGICPHDLEDLGD